MYAARWSPDLRQGDILKDVFFPGLSSQFKSIASETSFTSTQGSKSVESVIVPGERICVAVISHDCEFNEGKRNRLLLARIENVPGNLTSDQREALRASNDVRARAEAGLNVAGADSFLLDPLPGRFDVEQVIVFTTITPFPMKMRAAFLKAKTAELDHPTRILLREKVAWFFGRDAEDISAEERIDPPNVAEVEAAGDSN